MKIALSFLIFSFFCSCHGTQPDSIVAQPNPSIQSDHEYSEAAKKRRQRFAKEARQWCASRHYNERIFLLADMSLPSGKKRLFVYDMKKDTVISTGMVAHGCCNDRFLQNARFSNAIGCGCSSFGKYQISGKYEGAYGTAYRLIGLDSSNSNAAKRNIVLHSYYSMPDKEAYPDAIGNSYGCVMVSETFFTTLEAKIDASSKPVLLWVVKE